MLRLVALSLTHGNLFKLVPESDLSSPSLMASLFSECPMFQAYFLPQIWSQSFLSKLWFSWPLERTICILGGLTGIWSVTVSRPFQWAERGNMSSLFLKYKSIQFKFRTTEVLFNLFFIFYMINITICNAWHQSLTLPSSYKQCLKIATLPPPL